MHGMNKRKKNKTTMRQRLVGQRRHRKGRGRWYDNNLDSDSWNSTITTGGERGGWDGEETNTITIQ